MGFEAEAMNEVSKKWGWFLAIGIIMLILGMVGIGATIALLYGAVGYTMVKNPMLASATLTLFIAWALIAIGIMRMIVVFQIKGVPGWIWTLIGGIAAIVLGIMILNNWPESGLWVIGMFVAIELIFNGWGMIMIGLAAKKLRSGDIRL
jgi:uncharacterized membrane protein HdeD (DUF308 family)